MYTESGADQFRVNLGLTQTISQSAAAFYQKRQQVLSMDHTERAQANCASEFWHAGLQISSVLTTNAGSAETYSTT